MNVFTKFHANPSNKWNILLKTKNVNPMVALEEKTSGFIFFFLLIYLLDVEIFHLIGKNFDLVVALIEKSGDQESH